MISIRGTNHHQPSQLMMNDNLEVDRTQSRAYGADYGHRKITPSFGKFDSGNIFRSGGRGYNTLATNHHQPSQLVMNNDLEVDRTQSSAYGDDYGHRKITSAAVWGERNSSPCSRQEASSYCSSRFLLPYPSRHQPTAPPRIAAGNIAKFGRADSELDALRAKFLNMLNMLRDYKEELPRTDPVTGSEQQQMNSQSLKTGAAGAGEASSSTWATLTSSASAISPARTFKLKWQPRPEPVEKQPVSSPRAVEVVMSSRGIVDDDRITSGLSHEDHAKETGKYVPKSNWRGLPSRRTGKHDDNRDYKNAQQQHIQRTPSDRSEKNFDVCDSPSAYGAGSEASSTMDEGEGNDRGGNVGFFSPPAPLHIPALRASVPRSQSRSVPPRSNVSSGRVNGYSEDTHQAITWRPELGSRIGRSRVPLPSPTGIAGFPNPSQKSKGLGGTTTLTVGLARGGGHVKGITSRRKQPKKRKKPIKTKATAPTLCQNSGYSEDGNPDNNKMPTDLDSLDKLNPHMDKANRPKQEQNSWDVTRVVALSSSSSTNSPVSGRELRLQKSSSDEYVNMISEHHQPGVRSKVFSGQTLGDVYQEQGQQQEQQQQQQVDRCYRWVARVKSQQPAPRSSSNSAVSSAIVSPSPPHGILERPSWGSSLQPPTVDTNFLHPGIYLRRPIEPNPLTPSQNPGSHPAPQTPPPPHPNQLPRTMPDSSAGPRGVVGGQLPPNQVIYPPSPPPLPPPDDLPYVSFDNRASQSLSVKEKSISRIASPSPPHGVWERSSWGSSLQPPTVDTSFLHTGIYLRPPIEPNPLTPSQNPGSHPTPPGAAPQTPPSQSVA